MEIDYKEVIARQAQKIIELEDKLAESNKKSDLWFDEYQRLRVTHAPQGDSNA